MKNYSTLFDLNRPVPQTIWVSKHSAFRFSVDAVKNDQRCDSIKLYDGDTEISAVGTFQGGQQFSMTAGEPSRKEYKVVADGANFVLTIVATDSDVAELSCDGSGGIPYELPIAGATTLGGVKINGNNLTIALDGTLSAKDTEYTLPIADYETLGGVKVNNAYGIIIDEEGTLSVVENETQFTNWKNDTKVVVGQDAEAAGTYDITIGNSATTTDGSASNIVIGASSATGNNNLAIGSGHSVNGDNNVVVGTNIYGAGGYDNTVTIGWYAQNNGDNSIAIGNSAYTSNADSIQLGSGQNTDGNALQVRDWALMDVNGNIPQDRMGNVLSTVTESTWSQISSEAESNKIYFIIEG